jgi:hypothetical protein
VPALVGTGTAGGSSAQGITGIVRPSTVIGNYIVCDLYWESAVLPANAGLATSNGVWATAFNLTQAGSTPNFSFLRFISCYAGEGPTFDFTWNATLGAVWRVAVVRAYVDLDQGVILGSASALVLSSQIGAASGATPSAPSLTTPADFSELDVGIANVDAATTSAWSSPLAGQVTFNEVSFACGIQLAAGASGAKQATLSAGSWWIAAMLAMKGRPNVIRPGTPAWGYPYPLPGGR